MKLPLPPMPLLQIALVVADYDEAIRFYVDKLGFDLVRRHAAGRGETVGTCGPSGRGRLPVVVG